MADLAFPFCRSVCRRGSDGVWRLGFALSSGSSSCDFWRSLLFVEWSVLPSWSQAWCLVLSPRRVFAQGRRWWRTVGAYTRMLAGRVARVFLWSCVCVFRRFQLHMLSMAESVVPLMTLSDWQPASRTRSDCCSFISRMVLSCLVPLLLLFLVLPARNSF